MQREKCLGEPFSMMNRNKRNYKRFCVLLIIVLQQNFAMVNRIWPTAVAGKADNVSSVSASAGHIGGTNSVNPGQILLVYGTVQFNCESGRELISRLKKNFKHQKLGFAVMLNIN